jgi:HK97 family phage major capsid protein
MDLFSQERTDSDFVEYGVLDSISEADPFPEATTSDSRHDGEVDLAAGGYVSEFSAGFSMVRAPVADIGVWLPITKKTLQDSARIASVVDGALRLALRRRVELELFQGQGPTVYSLLGLANVDNTGGETGGSTAVERAELALNRSLDAGAGHPTAFVMHRASYASLDDPDPFRPGPKMLHGLPVVFSEGCERGVAWVAPFKRATVFTRGLDEVQASVSHADFFTRSLVALLATTRLAFGVETPGAFVQFELEDSPL